MVDFLDDIRARGEQSVESGETVEVPENTPENYRFDTSQDKYWCMRSGRLLSDKGVNGEISMMSWERNENDRPIPPSTMISNIDSGLVVGSSTWWPGQPQIIADRMFTSVGDVYAPGAASFNSYRPPDYSKLRSDKNPDRFLEHVRWMLEGEGKAELFLDWCAHAVQHPGTKPPFQILLSGVQGCGKDSALFPMRHGVGSHNIAEIGPELVVKDFNEYLQSVLIVVNEVRPHDQARAAIGFYNASKTMLMAPPDWMRINPKYGRPFYIKNVCHVTLTTNDPLTMHIPAGDRRICCLHSEITKEEVATPERRAYFKSLWEYLKDGGQDAAVRWLMNRDLTEFNKINQAPMNAMKQAISEAATVGGSCEVDEVLDDMEALAFDGKLPPVLFSVDLLQFTREFAVDYDENFMRQLVRFLKTKRLIYAMERKGYTLTRNQFASEWFRKKGNAFVFRSKNAFVRSDIAASERQGKVEWALPSRPLKFKNLVVAAREGEKEDKF